MHKSCLRDLFVLLDDEYKSLVEKYKIAKEIFERKMEESCRVSNTIFFANVKMFKYGI